MTEDGIRAVYFDMGGVLMNVSTEYTRESALEYALTGPEVKHFLGSEFSIASFVDFMSRSIEERAVRQPGLQEDAWRIDKQTLEIFTGRPVPYSALREKFWRQVEFMVRCFLPVEGVKELLEKIRLKGLEVGLISNVFHPSIIYKELFTEWDIIGYFNPLLFSSEFKYKKPHPAIFEYAMSWHPEIDPSQSMFVGDTWEIDVVGARGAGLKPVWVNREYAEPVRENVPVIPSVHDVLDLLG
ncbi:MAG TPA: HAD family hydrolase [bacterium]|nr:HAD family hydrolase [bacterium]